MSNITLYELAAEYRQAAEQLSNLDFDEQTIADTLEGMAGDFEEKAKNVAMFIRNLEATDDAIYEAILGMEKRRERIVARILSIKKYLEVNMVNSGITKIESPYLKMALRKLPRSVEIYDEKLIPENYMRKPLAPPPTPNKIEIREALKEGIEIPGARLNDGGIRLEIKV